MNFGQPKKPTIKEKPENCKIKIKRTRTGKELDFSGKCDSSQIDIAREALARENANDSEYY